MYHRLLAFKAARGGAPVIVSMGALGTSGGYYLACAADEIVAQRTTLTGNIGVLLPRWNFSKFGEKYGIEDSSIAATGTPYKTAGSAWKAESPEETAYIRGLLDSAFSEFRMVVSIGRKGKLKSPLEQIADGRAFSAIEAHDLGLVDRLGYLSDACDRAATLAHLQKKTVVRYEKTPGMLQLLGMARSSVTSPNAGLPAGVQSDGGVTLRIDGSFLRDLMTPRPLYLWRGE
jgi:protease-4